MARGLEITHTSYLSIDGKYRSGTPGKKLKYLSTWVSSDGT